MYAGDGRERRTQFEIIAEILGTCQPEAKKATIMFRCNLSFYQFTAYLEMILGARLLQIEKNGSQRLFRISGRGRDFLRAYEDLKNLMESSHEPLGSNGPKR